MKTAPLLGTCGLLMAAWLGLAVPTAAHPTLPAEIHAATAEVAAHPDRAEPYLVRADLFRRQEDFRRAEADYERALELDPTLQAVHLGRARLFLAEGALANAQSVVDLYLAAVPEAVEALLLRARILAAEGRPVEAMADLDAALVGLDHPQPEHYLKRAELSAQLGPAGLDAAVRGLDAGLARLGEVPSMTLLAADLEAALGRVDAAVERLDRLATRVPPGVAFLLRKAEILARAERRLESLAACTEALETLDALSPRARNLPSSVALAERLHALLRSGTVESRSASGDGP